MRIFHLIGMLCVFVPLAAPARAGERVLLRSGYRLHADRHELADDKIRLFSEGGGMVEIPAASIESFEADEENPVRPVPAMLAAMAPALGIAPMATALAVIPPLPQELAAMAARKFSLPEAFVRSVMKAESGFQPAALSPKGAIGLMQLMPGTAHLLGVDAHDPKQNAEGGARYLRDLLAKYENNPDQVLLALAAYNAGPGAVDKYHGVPPFRETHDYILRVLKNWDRRDDPK